MSTASNTAFPSPALPCLRPRTPACLTAWRSTSPCGTLSTEPTWPGLVLRARGWDRMLWLCPSFRRRRINRLILWLDRLGWWGEGKWDKSRIRLLDFWNYWEVYFDWDCRGCCDIVVVHNPVNYYFLFCIEMALQVPLGRGWLELCLYTMCIFWATGYGRRGHRLKQNWIETCNYYIAS